MVKNASFSTDNGKTSRFSFFYRINFLTIKSSSQNISITLALTDSALTSRGDRIGEKSSRERFCKNSSRCQKILLQVMAVGNGVIFLTTPIGCHCNPDHDKFHWAVSNTTGGIFLNVCLWRHNLRSHLEGIDPEKLYLATFICQYAHVVGKYGPRFFS